jgi:hypothetical protein
MADSQFISELMLVILERRMLGFDQDALNELYAKYDEPSDTAPEFNEEAFIERFSASKTYLLQMEKESGVLSKHARGFINFYTLWAFVALTEDLPAPGVSAERYAAFMQKVERLAEQQDLEAFLRGAPAGEYALSLAYLTNSSGANTDLGPRNERLAALRAALLG